MKKAMNSLLKKQKKLYKSLIGLKSSNTKGLRT